MPDPEYTNGDAREISLEELSADRRRIAGGTIWRDLLLANNGDGRVLVSGLLNLLPEIENKEHQIALVRAIELANKILDRDSRLLNFRSGGGD